MLGKAASCLEPRERGENRKAVVQPGAGCAGLDRVSIPVGLGLRRSLADFVETAVSPRWSIWQMRGQCKVYRAT